MQVVYRLGQSWSYSLLKREQQLSSARLIERRLSDEPAMHTPEMIRLLSYILAYPTVEDVDGSYSIIIVAHKQPTRAYSSEVQIYSVEGRMKISMPVNGHGFGAPGMNASRFLPASFIHEPSFPNVPRTGTAVL